MIKVIHFKSDFKQIVRDPIIVVLLFVPLLAITTLRIGMIYGFPLLNEYFNFDMTPYIDYFFSVILLIIPLILGTVMGFLMIDERDGHIYELMCITPLGLTGYIFNRILIPLIGGLLYTFSAFLIYNMSLSIETAYLGFLIGIEGMILGLLLFGFADDKVKGLTYSKGMGIFILFALSDLLSSDIISFISAFFPFYWISYYIRSEVSTFSIVAGLAVHIIWLSILVYRFKK